LRDGAVGKAMADRLNRADGRHISRVIRMIQVGDRVIAVISRRLILIAGIRARRMAFYFGLIAKRL
jgi:hypothetical protein